LDDADVIHTTFDRHGRASEARPGHPGFVKPSGGNDRALTLAGRLKAGHDDFILDRNILSVCMRA
jgi:hypothetical protein